ncbi:MAG: hypothetical protein JWM08_958 [Candidatus Angelobacter sp.]|nr:hypothetical protein [Candidatus Angelobacter sp.]
MQANASISTLPLQLAIRLVLDDVIFSNCLPDWVEPVTIDYSAREQKLADKVRQYRLGSSPPPPSIFEVPKKSGAKRTWILPAINDQIILQACVSSFAESLQLKSLGPHVYSYRVNVDPDRLGFMDDQLGGWINFQDETIKRCGSGGCLLQFDLQEAFRSIDRERLYSYLADICEPGILTLFKKLLESFSHSPGLPLLNDTVFFLGNAYLSEVDSVVRKHAKEFIRFVDDYRVFGKSPGEMESIYSRISGDLEHLGFKINPAKVHVGSADEFLELFASSQDPSLENDYLNPVLMRGIIPSAGLTKSLVLTINDPDRYLNEGYGRLQLAKLRKARFVESVAIEQGLESTTRSDLAAALAKNSQFTRRYIQLLEAYSKDPAETWRAVALVYMAHDLTSGWYDLDSKRWAGLKSVIKGIQRDTQAPTVLRLWARHLLAPTKKIDIEKMHDLNYFESGLVHWGEI